MADYQVALPDGRSVVVTAGSEDEARSAAQNFLMREPSRPAASGPLAGTPFAADFKKAEDYATTRAINAVGGLAGLPQAAAHGLAQGVLWGYDKLGIPLGPESRTMLEGYANNPPPDIARQLLATTGKSESNLEGAIPGGRFIDKGIEAAIASRLTGGPVIPGFTGGVGSEAAAQLTKNLPPWIQIPSQVLGATVGYMLGNRLVTPLPSNLNPQKAETVQIAKNMNPPVPLSVAEETGRGTWLERLFNRVPGGIGNREKLQARQGTATDANALREAGYTLPPGETGVSIPVMRDVGQQAKTEFEAAKQMPGEVPLASTIAPTQRAVANYEDIMGQSSPTVTSAGEKITNYGTNFKPLPGLAPAGPVEPVLPRRLAAFMEGPPPATLNNEQYQGLRRQLGQTIDSLYAGGKDPTGARAVQAMRDSLDEAAQASLGPEKAAAWADARRHYFNFKVIEDAMNKGTIASRAEGTIGANALTRALKAQQGDNFYATTGGLNDVARVKEYLRDTFPNSGTPTLGAQIGAFLHPVTAIPAIGGVFGGSRVMTGGYGAGWLRDYLANQARAPEAALNWMNAIQSVPPAVLAASPSLGPRLLAPPQEPRLGPR